MNEDAPNDGEIEQYMERMSEQYLHLREAICWIAFGSYAFPPVGTRSYLELMAGDSSEEHDAFLNEGAFNLAQSQLVAAASRGLVELAGRHENEEGLIEDQAGKPAYGLSLRMRPIPASDLDDFYEDGGRYHAKDKWYDRIVVSAADLERVGGLCVRVVRGSANGQSSQH